MDGQRFDGLAKTVAHGATRRQALRRLGGGLAGGALAALGLGRAAVRAQGDPAALTCPACRQCIAGFFGQCMETCARVSPSPQLCAIACCQGARTTCTVLQECGPLCTAPCPGEAGDL